MNTQFFLLNDVSRILNVRPSKIAYLLSTRQVEEPALRLGQKRVFNWQDIQRLAAKLDVELVAQAWQVTKGGRHVDK